MSSDDLVPTTTGELGILSPEMRRIFASNLRSSNKAENTRRSYHSDWLHFQRWAVRRGVPSCPAAEESLVAYLLYWGDPSQARQEGDRLLSSTTLARRVYGVWEHHRIAGMPIPDSPDNLVAETVKHLSIVQRSIRPRGRKRALSRSQINLIADACDSETAIGIRNRSILLLAFYAAFRRSSVTELDLDSVELSPEQDAVRLYVAHSKTDQRGEGRNVYVSAQEDHCPVAALTAWLDLRGTGSGPLYRNLHHLDARHSGRLNPAVVNRIVKWGVAEIGLDPAPYGAHSLRSGFATQAAQDGVDPRLIKEQTGHKSYEMLDRYIQDGTRWNHNATIRKT